MSIERELGWKPSVSFEAGLAETVVWYATHGDLWTDGAALLERRGI